MGNEAKRAYLRKIQKRYKNGDRASKSAILDEFCNVCGYHRKYAVRLLGRGLKPRQRPLGRQKIYCDDLIPHIRSLWFSMEQTNAKRMHKMLPLWLKPYRETLTGKGLTGRQYHQLRKISPSTLERFLSRIRKLKGLSTTKVNHALKNQIPIEIMDYKITKPGAMQADTVIHANGNLNGPIVHSLTMVDICTGWTENRAIWTKEAKQVRSQIESIEREIPFELTWFASDCGSEFLNYHVLQYLHERKKPIKVSRGRPYQKNDQAYVEQRNWTHVRQLFHYDRIDQKELIKPMNEIYEIWNDLHNYFFASVKILKKEVAGKRIKKTYDQPKTPAQRLLENSSVTASEKEKIKKKLKTLNPFKLKAELERRLKQFYLDLKRSPKALEAA